MRISDWSSECALPILAAHIAHRIRDGRLRAHLLGQLRVLVLVVVHERVHGHVGALAEKADLLEHRGFSCPIGGHDQCQRSALRRSEEHTSELQSLMRISYAVFCLKKKKLQNSQRTENHKTILTRHSLIENTHVNMK